MGRQAGGPPDAFGRPVSDTGTIRMEGTFQRASSLRNTPLNLKIDFTKGQLGQITALVLRARSWLARRRKLPPLRWWGLRPLWR